MKLLSSNILMALIILIAGLTFTGGAVFLIVRDIENTVKSEFSLVCNEIKTRVFTRLSAHAQLLRSSSALFAASDTITRAKWRTFNEQEKISKNLPGIQGVGYSVIIKPDKLQEHIETIRKEGFPDYNVIPAGKRDVYTSIIYLEPFTGRNIRAFGYDMFSDPVRRKAMEISCDSNVAMLSGKVVLVQETGEDSQAGTLMYVPVYQSGMAVSTVKERRAAIKGWVYSPYRMNDLMFQILRPWESVNNNRIHLKIYDSEITTNDSLLFDNRAKDTLNIDDFLLTTLSLPMDFNGKEWSLRFTRSRDQFSYFSGKVMIVLSSGIIISFLLFFLYLSFLVARNRMRTAEQLSLEVRESEKKFRTLSTQFEAILDHIPGLVFYKDKSNNFIRVNRFMADEHCKSKDELEGKNLADLYPEADAAKYYEDDLLVFNSGAPRLNIEENWVTPKGVKWVNSSKIPFVDDSGKTIGIIGISMDITEKKKYEQTLRETNDYLENLINYANAPIIVWDTQFRITRFNHAFEFITGRTEEEVLGLSVEILFPPSLADKSMGQLRKTVTGERWETEEIEILHLDKSVRTILWNSATLFTRDGHEPIATIAQGQDITERKKSEASLLKAKKEAETANKSKSIFLANMSHEIRTPLNAIIGFSQLISRDKLLTATQKEYNLSIIRSGEHLLSLINDILELSKVEAGRIVLNLTNINLHIFLYEIQTVFKDRAQSKRLQFILETASDLPQYVVVDESKLRRIFVNLIENAIKFTDEGGIAVRVRADMARDGAGKLIVEVQDSGPGISLSEQTNLFKQFVQTSTGIKKGSGTGLGLVLSRELARLMGGEINLTSEVGRGSVFSFNIEIKPGKAESVSTNVPRRVICIDKKETIYRILVVDDKEENLRVVVDLLRMVGFETNEAVNGADAITKFETWNPHLILMDLRMPLMDGYEAANLIKSTEAGKRTPIIALTASAFEEIHVKEKMPWLQGYIRKPFREIELFSTIGSILGINYNYENDTPVAQTKYLNKHELLVSEIEKLPEKLVSQLTDALAVADINQMIKLINRIESDNPELAQYLLTLVADYNYDYLLRIFNRKETTL